MPRAKKHIIKFINVPILNDEYNVIISFGTEVDARRVFETVGHVDEFEFDFISSPGVTMRTHGVTPVIAMAAKPETPAQYGVLAHEACHAVAHIFEHIGQPLCDEVFCHSVEAVVRAAGKEPETLVVTEH